eukprot:scaffold6.g2834.t1
MEDDEPRPCPRCGEQAVVFDHVQGLSACESCGGVLEEANLVQHIEYDEQAGRLGVHVQAGDTGERAVKLTHRLREVAARMALPPRATDQALQLVQRAAPRVMQQAAHWRREDLVGAALYAACRLERLPYTLVELTNAMGTEDPFMMGRRYRDLLALLALQAPQATAEDLLPRCVARVLGGAEQAGRAAQEAREALQKDAELALAWMARQLHSNAPGAAARPEAAGRGPRGPRAAPLSLPARAPGPAPPPPTPAAGRPSSQVKKELVALAPLLPYGSGISAKTVGSHARMIMRLSAIAAAAAAAAPPTAAAPAGGSDGGGARGAARGGGAGQAGGQPGPASAALLERQVAAARAEGTLEGRAPKRRRRRKEAAAGAEKSKQQQQDGGAARQAPVEGGEEEEGEPLSDLSDSEVAEYLRPAGQRALLQQVAAARRRDAGGQHELRA